MKISKGWLEGFSNLAIVGLFLALVGLLLAHNFSGLLPGGSSQELVVESLTASWPSIIESLVWWPYYLLVKLASPLSADGILVARSVSLGLAITAAGSFLLILRHYWSLPIALIGSGLLVSNSWFIQLARVAGPQMFGICLVLVIWLLALQAFKRPTNQAWFISLILVSCLGLFVPMLAWLVLLTFILAIIRQRLGPIELKLVHQLALGLVCLIFIGLFISSLSQAGQADLSLVGISSELPSFSQIIQNSLDILIGLGWQLPANPSQWLANLPILDAFGSIMLLFGIYHFLKTLPPKSRSFVFQAGLGLLIYFGISGGVLAEAFAMALPFIALLVIGGLQEIYQLWQQTFPTNPLAKSLIALVLVGLVGLSVTYQTNRYFVAWAGAPATKEIYSASINQ